MINYHKYPYKLNKRTTNRRKKIYLYPSYNIDDIYRFYRETFVNYSPKKKELKVDRDLFKTIQYEYNKVLSGLILKGHQVKLPYSLGEIGINKKKLNFTFTKGLEIDWNYFREHKQKIFYFNNDNHWKARWYWNKKGCKISNNKYYSFTATRTNRNKLTKIMQTKTGYTNYFTRKPRYRKP